jgi:predicted lipid-binding transport protein (Tim44 family)
MKALPDLDPYFTASVIPSHSDGRELLASTGLSAASIGSSFMAMASAFPMNGAISLAGVVMAGVIQVARMFTDRRLERLASDLNHARSVQIEATERARITREEAAAQLKSDRERIGSLVGQLDSARLDERAAIGRYDRLVSALVRHAPDVAAHILASIEADAKPLPTVEVSPVDPEPNPR